MTIREQTIAGLKWTAGGKLAAQAITWGITLIVMRLLHPEDYGLLAMASVFVAFTLMLSEAGLTPAIIQKQRLDETELRQIFAIIISVNLILLILLNLTAPFIANFFDDDRLITIIRVLSVQFLLVITNTIPQAILYRNLKFKTLSLIDLTATLTGSLLTLAIAFMGYGVWALIWGSIFSGIWKMIAFNIIAPLRLLPIFSLQKMRGVLLFGGNITLARLLGFFFTQVDVIIVGKLLGKEMLGFYSVAMQLATMPVQRVSAIVNQVSFPVFTKIQDDLETLQRITLKAVRILSFIAFPILWGISSIASEIIILFLGEKWSDAIIPFQLLALMMPLRILANFMPAITDAVGRPDVSTKNTLIASCVIPPALLIGAIQGGLVGVAIAWIVTSPILFFFGTRRSLKVIDIKLLDFINAIKLSVCSAGIMYMGVWAVGFILGNADFNSWIRLAIMIAAGITLYGGMTLVINKPNCQEIINLFRQR